MSSFAVLMWQMHPKANRPMIDYDVSMLFQPIILIGASTGVVLNLMFPSWLTLILLFGFLLFTFYRTFQKARQLWKKEGEEAKKKKQEEEKKKQQEMEEQQHVEEVPVHNEDAHTSDTLEVSLHPTDTPTITLEQHIEEHKEETKHGEEPHADEESSHNAGMCNIRFTISKQD